MLQYTYSQYHSKSNVKMLPIFFKHKNRIYMARVLHYHHYDSYKASLLITMHLQKEALFLRVDPAKYWRRYLENCSSQELASPLMLLYVRRLSTVISPLPTFFTAISLILCTNLDSFFCVVSWSLKKKQPSSLNKWNHFLHIGLPYLNMSCNHKINSEHCI